MYVLKNQSRIAEQRQPRCERFLSLCNSGESVCDHPVSQFAENRKRGLYRSCKGVSESGSVEREDSQEFLDVVRIF